MQRLVIIDVATAQVTPTPFTQHEQKDEEISVEDMLAYVTGRKTPPPRQHKRSVTLKYAMSVDGDALAVAATHLTGDHAHLTVTVVSGEQHQDAEDRSDIDS